MTESTNYKFKLPSSAVGVNDEADIDVISENFSKIDSLLKNTTDKSNTSVQYTEITGTTIALPLENGIYFVKNDSTVSGANVTIPANSVFSYNGGYQVDGSTYNALLTMLKGVVSSSGDTFQNIIVSGSNSTGSLSLSYKIDNFAGNATVQSALIKKQDNLVSGTNIKTINGNSILGSGNLEISEITVDDALSDTSTNPVQNKVVKSALDSKLEVKKLTVTDNTLSRAQLAALDAGIYEVDLGTSDSAGLQVTINGDGGSSNPRNVNIYSGTNKVRFVVENYFIGWAIQFSKRIHANICDFSQGYPRMIGDIIQLTPEMTVETSADIVTFMTTDNTLSSYKLQDYISESEATAPSLDLSAQKRDSIYQYSNVLTSLTITVPTTPININQSIRLIFKTTSATTITVPSGLYFRGDDCNDSYVFIPRDNKVYDIIITYNGFNYNGIVVGTPATR